MYWERVREKSSLKYLLLCEHRWIERVLSPVCFRHAGSAVPGVPVRRRLTVTFGHRVLEQLMLLASSQLAMLLLEHSVPATAIHPLAPSSGRAMSATLRLNGLEKKELRTLLQGLGHDANTAVPKEELI